MQRVCEYCGITFKTYERAQRFCSRSHAGFAQPKRTVRSPDERFAEHAISGEGCTEWTGLRDGHGYGRFWRDGRIVGAHRHAWESVMGGHPCVRGPLASHVEVLHRCDNPPCVRIDHLFLGTQRDNIDDMVAKGRAKVSECRRGHPLVEGNVRVYTRKTGRVERQCLTCWRDGLAKAHAQGRIREWVPVQMGMC